MGIFKSINKQESTMYTWHRPLKIALLQQFAIYFKSSLSSARLSF